jgi:dipeptidyl aminopeptidase/acylaminoacyl peptidase
MELARGSDARFIAPSTLMFTQRGELMAATFDPATPEITGIERPVVIAGAKSVLAGRTTGDEAMVGTQAAGLALFPMEVPEPRTLVWVDREGNETPTGFAIDRDVLRLSVGANGAIGAALSPDGTKVALVTRDAPVILDLADIGRWRTLPPPGRGIAYAVWEPSGESISVLGNAKGSFHGYLISVTGTGQPQQISDIPQSVPLSFFPDGKSVLGYVITADAGRDLWVFGLDGDDTPVLQTPANERAPVLSPDGGAFAYVSDESGEDRVYLRLYPDVGQAWAISGDGATMPRWSRDGREVFFQQGAQMMAVEVDLSDGVVVGTPQALFGASSYEQDPFAIPMYDVATDGRFLMVRRGTGPRIWRVVQNWSTAIEELDEPR